jgi:hypothetical protein
MPGSELMRAQSGPLVQRTPMFDKQQNSIPGYTGFVPGRNAESLEGSTFRRMNSEARLQRSFDRYDHQDLLKTRYNPPAVEKRPRSPIPRDARGLRSPAAGDQHESVIMRTSDLPHGAGGPEPHSHPRCAIPKYGGYIPGKDSENVYGDTWTKVNNRAVAAHHMSEHGQGVRPLPRPLYDGRQNEAFKRMMTYERTVVPRVETDNWREMPLINPSVQDLVRGTSSCPFTGKHVDPAGRDNPNGRTDSWGRTAPPAPWRAHGYAGYQVGKYAENVHGERQSRTEQIALHLHRKNRLRITQT